jgi:hypothetical protein
MSVYQQIRQKRPKVELDWLKKNRDVHLTDLLA